MFVFSVSMGLWGHSIHYEKPQITHRGKKYSKHIFEIRLAAMTHPLGVLRARVTHDAAF
jgi:hypothetical protein